MRWFEIVDEAFVDKPVNWSQKSNEWNDMKKFNFKVGEHPFHGFFVELDKGNWTLHFVSGNEAMGTSTANTGMMGSQALQVFSHVTSAIQDFIGKYDPLTITFDGDERLGKAKLYLAMARHLKPKLAGLGYRTAVEGSGDVSKFTIEKLPSQ